MSDPKTEITVETTGDFMLFDPTSGQEIPHQGFATVSHTAFVKDRIELGQLKEVAAEKPAPKKPAPKQTEAA